jgi:hypothetical protein
VSTTYAPDRFTALPDEQTLAATVVALEEHGFSPPRGALLGPPVSVDHHDTG